MSSIFDGIIVDGILMAVGDRFVVTATDGMGIRVGSGRAWFDRTWTYNDSTLALNVKNSETVLDRIDAVVIEVDTREEARTNSVRFVYGAPSGVPERPALVKEEYVKQYPLCYIYVAHGTTRIDQENITNMVGTEETPFATGPLETIDASFLLAQWNAQWSAVFAGLNSQKTGQQTAWETQTNQQQAAWADLRAILLAWYDAIRQNLARYASFNFNNLPTLPGTTRITKKTAANQVTATITVTGTSLKMAERRATRGADGSATVTETLFAEDGAAVLRYTSVKTSKQADGSVKDVTT
jgi:hypothetical protein